MFVMSHHLLAQEWIYHLQKTAAIDNRQIGPERLLASALFSKLVVQILKDDND
jgi:hypothetical protein